MGFQKDVKLFDYLHIYPGKIEQPITQFFKPIKETPDDFKCVYNEEKQIMEVKPFTLNQIAKMPQRLSWGSWCLSRMWDSRQCQFIIKCNQWKCCFIISNRLRNGCNNFLSKNFF